MKSEKADKQTAPAIKTSFFGRIRKYIANSSFLWGQQYNDISVSVGHKNITAIELDKTGDLPVICGFQRKAFESDQPVSEQLKSIFSGRNFTNRFAITSLCGKSVIVRFVNFPVMPKKDLRSALEFEAEKYIPFDIDNVYMDFAIISEDTKKKSLNVAIVVAKKESINDLVNDFKNADIIIKDINIDSFAAYNTFCYSYPEELENVTALLNIGAKVSSLMVINDGTPAFSRDIYFGGDDLTAALSKKIHLPEVKAEEIKKEISADSDAELKVGYREALNYLLQEVKLSLDYFSKQFDSKKVTKIFMTGGATANTYLSEVVAQVINIPVENIDPLRNVLVSEKIESSLLNAHAASLTVPLGLALA